MESISKLMQFPLTTLGDSPLTLGLLLSVIALVLLGGLLVIWSPENYQQFYQWLDAHVGTAY